jgi:hypothetical protein
MPPRVFAIKLGMVAFYVLAALDARRAISTSIATHDAVMYSVS